MRVALYARVSTDNQSTENQIAALTTVGQRLDWNITETYVDRGISGAKGRDRRPGFDHLLMGVARRDFDLVAAWSVCRLGRSIQDLIGFLGELQARGVGLYLYQQGLDTTSPAGRAMFGMLSVFAEFERAMTVDRVRAGLQRARASGKRLGRPPLAEEVVTRIRKELEAGRAIHQTAKLIGVGVGSVQKIRADLRVGSLPV